jgi:hypothetical protein
MEFTYNGETYEYSVTYKKMKNIRVHVRNDGTVWVSAPLRAPDHVIRDVMRDNAAAIVAQIRQMREQRVPEPDHTDGSQMPYLGGLVTLRWSDKPCRTVLADGVLTLYARDPQDAELAWRRWLIDECVSLYRKINREVYEAYCKAGYKVPLARIEIKEMKSRWGSCTAKTGRISMNFRLMQYPLGCIYGVFYHEYAHFMYMDHSANFYRVLRGVYPEYDHFDDMLNTRKKG